MQSAGFWVLLTLSTQRCNHAEHLIADRACIRYMHRLVNGPQLKLCRHHTAGHHPEFWMGSSKGGGVAVEAEDSQFRVGCCSCCECAFSPGLVVVGTVGPCVWSH